MSAATVFPSAQTCLRVVRHGVRSLIRQRVVRHGVRSLIRQCVVRHGVRSLIRQCVVRHGARSLIRRRVHAGRGRRRLCRRHPVAAAAGEGRIWQQEHHSCARLLHFPGAALTSTLPKNLCQLRVSAVAAQQLALHAASDPQAHLSGQLDTPAMSTSVWPAQACLGL